jgi:hypothetical protein
MSGNFRIALWRGEKENPRHRNDSISIAVDFHVAEIEVAVRVFQPNTPNNLSTQLDTWLQTNFAELVLLMSKVYYVDMQH